MPTSPKLKILLVIIHKSFSHQNEKVIWLGMIIPRKCCNKLHTLYKMNIYFIRRNFSYFYNDEVSISNNFQPHKKEKLAFQNPTMKPKISQLHHYDINHISWYIIMCVQIWNIYICILGKWLRVWCSVDGANATTLHSSYVLQKWYDLMLATWWRMHFKEIWLLRWTMLFKISTFWRTRAVLQKMRWL